MNESDKDKVHQIRDEMVNLDIIPQYISLSKNDGIYSNKSSFFGTKISYESKVNQATDDAIIWFLGHEYGHQVIPQYSTIAVWLIIIVLIILIILSNILFVYGNGKILALLPVIIFLASYIMIWKLSKWLKEDEYRSDLFGAMVLFEYGIKKGTYVCPSKSYRNFFDIISVSFTNMNIIDKIFIKLLLKVDIFIHPSEKERIQNLEKFEKLFFQGKR